MRSTFYICALIATLLLSGCDLFSSSASKIPDDELRSKWRECKSYTNPAATTVLACENFQRECDRRKGKGNLVCY